MALLAVTQNYLRMGFCPIPITYRDKRPTVKWTAYKWALPSPEDLKAWFSREDLNVALVTGHGGLTVIDFDNQDVYAKWLQWAATGAVAAMIARLTYRVKTARGVHVYLRLEEIPATGPLLNADGSRTGIDIKARGGYVLAPPSIHPSGTPYRADRLYVPIASAACLSQILPPGLLVPEPTPPPPTEPCATVDRWADTPWDLADHADAKAVEKVKRAWRIEELLGELYKTGDHHYLTRCPLHDDGNPSMWVDLEQQICGCYAGCTRKPLDVINLYARIHGLSNTEAILSMLRR